MHVIDSFGPGGAQDIVYSVCKYGKNAANSVVILADSGTQWRRLTPYARVTILSRTKYNGPLILVRLFSTVIRNRRAVINGHLQASSLLLSLIRLVIRFNLILTIHAIPSQLPRWYNVLYSLFCRQAEYYVAEGMIVYRNLLRNKIAPHKVRYIGIGTEAVLNMKGPEVNIRDEFYIAKNTIVLLNIARMIKPKGQRDLLFVVKDLITAGFHMKYHLVIVGYGPEEKNLRRLARRFEIDENVTFAGKRTDLHNFYSCADWFLMPCYDESMGVVIYESLAYGVPVIAYDSGDITEVIDKETKGFIVPRGYKNVRDVVTKNNPPPKVTLSNDDRYKYSAQRMALEYQELYGSMQ